MKTKKIPKIIFITFMMIMIVIFFRLINGMDNFYDIYYVLAIMSAKSSLPLATKKTLLALYLFIMLCTPIFFTNSKRLPFLYCAIILAGTIIGKFKFWGVLIMVLSFPAMIGAAAAELLVWIIKLFFSSFNGIWLICVFQIIGHLIMIDFLIIPSEFVDELISKESSSKSAGGSYSTSGTKKDLTDEILSGFNDCVEEVRHEKREEEKLETLKDIDHHLRNR